MLILLVFALFSGLTTILAPCIWPLLPIILSTSATGGHKKPLGIAIGVTVSFAILTLSASYLAHLIPFNQDYIRLFAAVVITILGLSLLIPRLNLFLERAISGFNSRLPGQHFDHKKHGFWQGIFAGLSLGIIWSPCAGPILAAIAAAAATREVNWQIISITLTYSLGVGIPLFIFASFGTKLLKKLKFLNNQTEKLQKFFGVTMIVTAILIYTGQDRIIQTKLLNIFPQYSNFLFKIEGNKKVTGQLAKIKNNVVNGRDHSLPSIGQAPEFSGISHWLNTDKALRMRDLQGQVVLIDFWTYTCINCIRTLPHLEALQEKYSSFGFTVIGVHTPEFEFEKNTQNVSDAIKRFGLTYPVALDNDYSTWNAYNNQYWPAHYLIDKTGRVRYTHFGEGAYDETEKAIQTLLLESGKKVDSTVIDMKDITPQNSLTPETYLGSSRFENPSYLKMSGNWTILPEYSTVKNFKVSEAEPQIELDFSAQKVFLVIKPLSTEDIVEVYLDDKKIDVNVAGADVKDGKIVFDPKNLERLYEIINLQSSANHKLILKFKTPGTSVFAFTFG